MHVHVLECRRFSAAYRPASTLRTVKDYEIDLELGSERLIYVDEAPVLLRSGTICVRKPGQIVRGCSRDFIKQNTILLSVDFSGHRSDGHYSRNVEGPLQEKCDSPLIENLNGVITPSAAHAFLPIYTELAGLGTSDQGAAELLVTELLHRLNAEVCRQSYEKDKPAETPCGTVLSYIKNNPEKKITLKSLAELVHLDPNYLVRLFKDTYGRTPINMLIDLRMEKACDLITNTDLSILEISSVCGYASPSYFTAEFKKRFGLSPLRQRHRSR